MGTAFEQAQPSDEERPRILIDLQHDAVDAEAINRAGTPVQQTELELEPQLRGVRVQRDRMKQAQIDPIVAQRFLVASGRELGLVLWLGWFWFRWLGLYAGWGFGF